MNEKTEAELEVTGMATELGPILAISVAIFITTFDITAVVMAMPRIKASMALTIDGFAWVMDAYSLTFTVCLAAAGVLADRYGRRLSILLGNAIFLVASLACGLAENQQLLLGGRALQGVGAALIVCGGLAAIGHRYVRAAERARAFGILGSISGLAMALGPVGGGIIANTLGWHWIFFVNVPICVAVVIALLNFVAESKDPARRSVDIGGVISLTVLLLSVVWILLHGPNAAGVDVGPVIAALWIFATAAAFVYSQYRAAEPILALHLFRSGVFVAMCVVPLALSFGYWTLLVYLPLFLEQHLGISPGAIAVLMLAATLPMAILPMFSARAYLLSTPANFFAVGLIAVAFGCVILALGAEQHNMLLSLLGMVTAGSATAMTHTQVSGAIVSLVPREQAGAASAVVVILRQGGFAIGIAVLAAVLSAANGAANAKVFGLTAFTVAFLCAAISVLTGAIVVLLLAGRKATVASGSPQARA